MNIGLLLEISKMYIGQFAITFLFCLFYIFFKEYNVVSIAFGTKYNFFFVCVCVCVCVCVKQHKQWVYF